MRRQVSGVTATAEPPRSGALAVLRQRPWRIDLLAHGLSLLAILAVVVVAARGQWFYYDEWDFLAARAEWNLLAPHNGHLSLFPQLLTTLIKGVFGLSSYWPFLAFTILVHLIVVHLVWRVALRSGASWPFAVLASTVFGVLAPGADNVLWAFQVGFITPLATGFAALLIVSRETLRRRDLVWIAVLLIVGAGFAGTALPMTAAVLAYLLVRHGWRRALGPTIAFAVLYGAWYLVFNRNQGNDLGVRPGSLYDLMVRVPEYMVHAIIDSVGKMIPYAGLAPALVIALIVGVVLGLRGRAWREIPAAYYGALGALVFAGLSAYTRVGIGLESASSGRYVYIYAALLAPGFALGLTALAGRRSRVAAGVLVVLMGVLAVFNAGSLIREGVNQSKLERTVERAFSAALAMDDGSGELGGRTPSSIVAPTLTMNDLRSFVERGQFTPVAYTPSDALDVEINLFLTAEHESAPSPEIEECEPAVNGTVEVDPESEWVWAPAAGTARVTATEGTAKTEFATVKLSEGWNRLTGVTVDTLRLNQPDAGGLCVVPAP